MTRPPSDDEILNVFGRDAESEWDFARMVDRECSRSAIANCIDDDDCRSCVNIMTSNHHTRSQIVQLVGIENDVFTVWLRQGLVIPVDAAVGRGKVLRFDPYQVRVAKVLANGRSVGLNIDALRALAKVLQSAISTFLKADASPSLLTSIIEEIEEPGSLQDKIASTKRVALRNSNPALDRLIEKFEADGFEASLVKAASALTKDDLEDLWICVQLFEAEGYLMAYWDIYNGLWHVERHATLDGTRLPSAACILLDLAHLSDLPI